MTPDPEHRAEEPTALLEALRVLKERWWIVLLATIACTGAMVALSLSSAKQYKATATLLIKTSSLASLIDPTVQQTQDAARTQGDNLNLVKSRAVAQLVRSALNLNTTPDALLAKVDAAAVPDTDLINVSITDRSAASAAAIANAFGDQLVGFLKQTAEAQVAQGQAQINKELAQLPPSDTGSRALLGQALSRVQALGALASGTATVVDRAETPSSPSSPRPKRDVLIGAIVGLVLGVALAFLVDLFDRRIKDPEDFERLYGRAPLTTIQLQRARAATERERQFELEPFRILRDGLDFVSLRGRVQTVLVTSAAPAEGKTRVAVGLARAAAAAGRRVALVEVDLHKPTIARVLRLAPHPRGLTNVLAERTTPHTALHAVPDAPGLSVLTSGPSSPAAAEMLRSEAMDEVLRELRADFDFVVLDAPPLLHVSDAHALIDNPLVDVVLVVARPYVTTRDQARSARAVLDRHPEASVGLVVNGVRGGATTYYYAPDDDRGGRARRGSRRRDKVRS